jgi:eukaryotic-like serine/threonine-protein kinase
MSTQAAAPLIAGRYRLGPVIGRGAMGVVHRAHDERLGRDVAVKFLRTDLAAHESVRDRFEREAMSAARLLHPNVVTVFDSGEEDGEPHIIMECLPGRTLADELREGPQTVERTREMAIEVLSALSAAHELGIVHRDIKPANLLITEHGSFKVGDFGIAKSVDGLDQTETGEILGTAAYLAPERIEGQAATSRSDLYSLGVVMYEALTGTKPFVGDNPAAIAYAVHDCDPVPVLDLRPDADPDLVAVVERAMARNPDERFDSADAMAEALEPAPTSALPRAVPNGDVVLEGETGVLTPTDVLSVRSTPTTTAVRPVRRRTDKRPLIALAAVAIAAVIAFGVSHRDDSPRGVPPATGPSTTVAPGVPATTLPAPLATALDRLDEAIRS